VCRRAIIGTCTLLYLSQLRLKSPSLGIRGLPLRLVYVYPARFYSGEHARVAGSRLPVSTHDLIAATISVELVLTPGRVCLLPHRIRPLHGLLCMILSSSFMTSSTIPLNNRAVITSHTPEVCPSQSFYRVRATDATHRRIPFHLVLDADLLLAVFLNHGRHCLFQYHLPGTTRRQQE
jgi:hypothetical protein